jgi:glutamine phosphoribosylpyrophosphate amidotransferase
MRDLYNYKSGAGGQNEIAAKNRLFNGLYLSLGEHMGCFGGIDAVVTVPSSGGRAGAHPVEEMRRMFGSGFQHISVDYVGPARLDRQQRRVLAPERFSVDVASTRGRRVLLLDDAWVTGAHMQSVAATLKLAGAGYVAAVPIGRMVSPTYGESKTYLDAHPALPFDPSICPISGTTHS